MAALMESIAFTQIPNESDIIEVSESSTEGDILLSLRKKLIVIYKISDQKPQKSWSVKHGISLTSPVRWDYDHSRFVTVTNNHDVKLWNTDLADFSKAKTKHSITKVYEVLTLPNWPDVILLYSNGSVDLLGNIKNTHDVGPISDTDSITWCKACVMSSVLYVMFVARIKAKWKLFVNCYRREEEKWDTKTEVISVEGKKQDVRAIDSILVDDNLHIYTLWNDGHLSKATVQQQSISVITLPQRISDISTNSGMVVLDTTHVAVTGCKKGQEDGIAIFDIKFGLQKTWQAFTEKPTSKCKIFRVGGHLFYACRRTLYACRYECHTSTVSSILGRNVSNVSTIPQHHIWTQQQKNKEVKSMPEDLSTEFSQMIEKSMICILGMKRPWDEQTTVPDKGELLFRRRIDSSQKIDSNVNIGVNDINNYNTFKSHFTKLMKVLEDGRNQHWLTSTQMVSLVHKIVGETKYWASHEIQILVDKQFIPASAMDSVVDSLIQHSEINILHSLIKTTNNLPEKCMCKALSFYLQCEEVKIKSAVSKIDETIDSEVSLDSVDEGVFSYYQMVDDDDDDDLADSFSAEKAFLIDNVLVKPYSDVFLLECLRTLNFKDAETLFEYLGHFLARKSVLQDKDKNKKLNIPQVVDLLCLLIDAHMTQFVLSPYSHLTLIKMHNIVSNQVNFISSLVNLETLLLQLKEKSVLMQDKKVGQYCIEVLHID